MKKVYSSTNGNVIQQKFIDIMKKYHSGDPALQMEAKEEALAELEGYVHHIIKKQYSTYGKYYDDLVQEGKIGIICGLDKYDPSRSMPTTFFNFYIVHEMSKFIDTIVNRTTSHYSSNLSKINKTIDKFEKEGREWGPADIAIELGMNMETVIQCLAIQDRKNEVYYESDEILEQQISERGKSPEEQYLENERLSALYQAINSLDDTAKRIIMMKYGVGYPSPLSYKAISEELDIPIDKVKKIRHNSIAELKHNQVMKQVFRDNTKKRGYTPAKNIIAIIPEKIAEDTMDMLESVDLDE